MRIRRVAERATYDSQTVNEILDAGFVAHVGTVRDWSPVVIPMFYVRDGSYLLLHGAPATGALRRGRGVDVCVTVTHVDGLVLARSSFHHSMNYRSVVVIGTAEPVDDAAEKAAALEKFVEQLVPGRQKQLRQTTPKEIAGTAVLRVSLEQASAKVRVGEPVDDEEDYELPIWAGVVPVRTVLGTPIPDGRVQTGTSVPANVEALAT
ncbi:MAG: pyridoxamine 5'-phosphate oxidase family protein [Acidimicrobiales bacterium]